MKSEATRVLIQFCGVFTPVATLTSSFHVGSGSIELPVRRRWRAQAQKFFATRMRNWPTSHLVWRSLTRWEVGYARLLLMTSILITEPLQCRGVAKGGAHGARAPPLPPKIVENESTKLGEREARCTR